VILAERVMALAEADPDRTAFRYRGLAGPTEVLSRRAVVERAGRAAARLRTAGVRTGDVVALVLSEHSCQPVFFLACQLAGAVPAFLPPPSPKLDPAYQQEALREMLRCSGCRLVVVTPGLDVSVPADAGTATVLPCCDDGAADHGEPPGAVTGATPAPTALLQFSSGTTGARKGVRIGHRALAAQLARLAQVLAADESDRLVSWLPVHHDMGLIACLLLPMAIGAGVTQVPTFDWLRRPRLLFEAATEDRCTLVYLPNFAFRHLARPQLVGDGDVCLDSLRAVVNCSERIDADAFDRLLETWGRAGLRCDAMAASYALAENVFAVTHTGPGRPPRRVVVDGDQVAVSSGTPIAGTSVRAVDPGDGRSLGEGEVGELRVRGDCLMDGYLANPEATAAVLRDGEYATGDLGFLLDGEVFVRGRLSDRINVRGANVHPEDVERAASVEGVHPGRVAAVGVWAPATGTEVIAVLAEPTDAATDRGRLTDDIRRALAARVAEPVGHVVVVDPGWLVKTTSGKLARGACRTKAVGAGFLPANDGPTG